MHDLLFQGASAYQVARAAHNAVSAQDAELGASLSDIVDSVSPFELYDKEFSLEHLLSELALGLIGRPPTAAGGIKVGPCTEQNVFNGRSCRPAIRAAR